MGEFVRHAKMTAWGVGIVLEDRGGQRTVLFADGSRRSFKGDIAAKLLVPAEPESEEARLALERGAGSGGSAPIAVNLALEAQLPNDFSDPQPFLVYADWLEQRGDPRGKLIQAQHRGSAKLEREILKEHGAILNARPCKHALTLHAMLESGAHIDERVPPSNHYQLASRRRFTNIGE